MDRRSGARSNDSRAARFALLTHSDHGISGIHESVESSQPADQWFRTGANLSAVEDSERGPIRELRSTSRPGPGLMRTIPSTSVRTSVSAHSSGTIVTSLFVFGTRRMKSDYASQTDAPLAPVGDPSRMLASTSRWWVWRCIRDPVEGRTRRSRRARV